MNGNTKANSYPRGLGELICLKFAQEGCSIAINYNSGVDRAKAVATKIEKEHGMKVVLVQAVIIHIFRSSST